jgi:hypothetical protein
VAAAPGNNRFSQYFPFHTPNVILIEEFVHPSASVVERLWRFVWRADIGFADRPEVVMVGQTHRFNCKSGGDILILCADQVVAVIFFAAAGEVRGTAPNASCGAIEIRDHEFVMDSVARQ